jgi:hypothetical protein
MPPPELSVPSLKTPLLPEMVLFSIVRVPELFSVLSSLRLSTLKA